MKINGIAGVLVYTSKRSFAKMRRFYAETLALPVRSDRDGFVNFDWNGVRLTVAVHSDLFSPSLNRDPLHILINFETDDIVGEYERLTTAGVIFRRPPEPESWGGRVATFIDPDNNLLQLLELPQV